MEKVVNITYTKRKHCLNDRLCQIFVPSNIHTGILQHQFAQEY